MIRINLLGGERQAARAATVDPGRRVAMGSSAVLLVAAALLGSWYWSLAQASAQLDQEMVVAEQETLRLQAVLNEVDELEARRAGLIEQLRDGQSVPVRLLDHVSRSLPDLLWLDELAQEEGEVTISGFSTTLIAVSDFVGNLGIGGLLQRPIELVDSQMQPAPGVAPGADAEVIRFTVRALMAPGAGASAAPASEVAP